MVAIRAGVTRSKQVSGPLATLLGVWELRSEAIAAHGCQPAADKFAEAMSSDTGGAALRRPPAGEAREAAWRGAAQSQVRLEHLRFKRHVHQLRILMFSAYT
ncbi:hypothetical protein ON010_g106 [Phytophthora cinnamomi]|nr:hypothetical protein ON010_g106 [Phytophthora cinnamomi]